MFRYFSQIDALRLYYQRSRWWMCGKYGSVESARKVFDEITQRKISDWNVMVSGYWRCGNKEEACKVFDMMFESESNVVSWTVMITGFAKLKDLERSRWCFDRMGEKSVVS